MRKKIRIIVVAGVIAAVGGIAIAARDVKDEGKAAAPPRPRPLEAPPEEGPRRSVRAWRHALSYLFRRLRLAPEQAAELT